MSIKQEQMQISFGHLCSAVDSAARQQMGPDRVQLSTLV